MIFLLMKIFLMNYLSLILINCWKSIILHMRAKADSFVNSYANADINLLQTLSAIIKNKLDVLVIFDTLSTCLTKQVDSSKVKLYFKIVGL